jgi:multicomponent K+:H+ antiporter subunit G
VTPVLPLWVDLVTAVLVVVGALTSLVGAFGLLRLPTFFQRVHAPTLCSTVGGWSLALATVLQISFAHRQLFVHALLIGVFLSLTAPVTTIFLMRAAVFRARIAGEDVPPTVTGPRTPPV